MVPVTNHNQITTNDRHVVCAVTIKNHGNDFNNTKDGSVHALCQLLKSECYCLQVNAMMFVFFSYFVFRVGLFGFLVGKSNSITNPYKLQVGRVHIFRVFSTSGSGGFEFRSGFRFWIKMDNPT
ncbi:hypothetical protein Hanom_Chr07g00643481 [Helianthus anomalus]